MKKCAYLAFIALSCAPWIAKADLILGTLNVTGVAQISLGTIGFVDNELSINSPALAQGGGFAALEGTTGTIQNLTDPIIGGTEPVGPLDVPDFITFAAAPNISITLTYLYPGIDGAAGCVASPAAAGQVCTPDVPDQSPFNLQNTSGSSSTASFDILGFEVDSTTGDTIPISGIFTTQFADESFQQLLATVADNQTLPATFSAQFSTAPEPSSAIELILGVILLEAGRVRFTKKTKKTSISDKAEA
jgi:hypothetical protein